jgi:hypothetical protein
MKEASLTNKSLIFTTISATSITFKTGGLPSTLEVNASNYSGTFADLQLEVLAAVADDKIKHKWYLLSPEVSSKKPPGDSTRFIVQIIDAPLPGFVGEMNLTVRVFSIELQQESRQIVRLTVQEGTGGVPVKLKLPVQEFQAYPQQQVKIPVEIYNPSYQPTNAVLSMTGIDPVWLIEDKQVFQVLPNQSIETDFLCQIPDLTRAKSQLYPFTIEAKLTNGLSTRIEGSLFVLPQGRVELRCFPKQHRIPEHRRFFWRSDPVIYNLELENNSNLHQVSRLQIQSDDKLDCQVVPEQIELDIGETRELQVITKVKRHWIGIVKQFVIEVATELSDPRLAETSFPTQNLELKVLPLIPRWLLFASAMVGLGLLWWMSWLNPNNPVFGHHTAVNFVQFNGMVRNVISGSNDREVNLWRMTGFFNPLDNQFVGTIAKTPKAVRVGKYRPVDNNIVALGLENGEIQLWKVLGERKPLDIFSYQKDDRVFALEFTEDSRLLFSGHGSGLVLQWDTTIQSRDLTKGNSRLVKQKQFDFAVYTLKLVGLERNNLVVAGRYNQIELWNLTSDRVLKIPYLPGSQDDYILSADTAEFALDILVTADNQGNITTWNMRPCLQGTGECEQIDRWQGNQSGEAVRSVALSYNGCYLASGGDDGKVTLWGLTSEGKRARDSANGQLIQKEVTRSFRGKKINSVDLKLVGNEIFIASGSDDTQVRVIKEKIPFNDECNSVNLMAPN